MSLTRGFYGGVKTIGLLWSFIEHVYSWLDKPYPRSCPLLPVQTGSMDLSLYDSQGLLLFCFVESVGEESRDSRCLVPGVTTQSVLEKLPTL